MKNPYIRAALFLAFIIMAVVFANIAEGAEKIQEGNAAPYTGVILNEKEFNALVGDLRYAEKQVSNYQSLTETLDARIISLSNQVYILETIQGYNDEYIDTLNKIHELEKKKWYDSPPLWFSIGVLSGGALMYGGAWIAGTVR